MGGLWFPKLMCNLGRRVGRGGEVSGGEDSRLFTDEAQAFLQESLQVGGVWKLVGSDYRANCMYFVA